MPKRNYPCEFCDTETNLKKERVTVTRQRRGTWYIFEDVPAWVCLHCGHRLFDADVLRAMEDHMSMTNPQARPVTAWAISLAEKAD